MGTIPWQHRGCRWTDPAGLKRLLDRFGRVREGGVVKFVSCRFTNFTTPPPSRQLDRVVMIVSSESTVGPGVSTRPGTRDADTPVLGRGWAPSPDRRISGTAPGCQARPDR